jgi:septum site-determining protein MinC
VVSSVSRQRQSLMFRPRSYTAFAITPQAPIPDWLADLDATVERSKGFFSGHPVALDLSGINLSTAAILELVADLEKRGICILGVEGIDPAKWQPGFPSILRSGRGALPTALPVASETIVARPAERRAAPKQSEPASLLIEDPVRSGQSVVFMEGDVTVLGSVGSGAEIIAGGSIHVYGTLRGRALAGATGNARARIFCQRVEAELLAVDSYYRTADDIEDSLRRRSVQAWLEGGSLKISAMN